MVDRPPESPHIAALYYAHTDERQDKLTQFWGMIAGQGTPLLEPIPENESYWWVTFLYRASQSVSDVCIKCPLGGRGRIHESMVNLPGTDLWYKTYRARQDVRTEYVLAIDGREQPDPMNARTIVWPVDEDSFPKEEERWSWFELPGAPAQPAMQSSPGMASGRLESHRIRSEILANERPLTVYIPPDYAADGPPCDLLILFDRWAYAQVVPTASVLDHLLAKHALDPVIVVMIGHPDRDVRHMELACNPAFADFLAYELVPWIQDRYRVSSDPQHVTIGGMSLGGLAAVYAGLYYPLFFGKIFSQSGSFYWKPEADSEYEWLTHQFAVLPHLPLRFYLAVGLLETRPSEGGKPNLLLANRHLRDVLQARGYPVSYTEFNGGHDFIWQPYILADGLTSLRRARP